MMTYRELWNKCTVSSVLILPLFNDILSNVKSKEANAEYSLQGLCYDNGLINCYLFEKVDDNYDRTLKLLFKKYELCNNEIFLNKPLPTLFDLLVNCKYFSKINIKEDEVIIYLSIDHKWDNDINKIINSRYSAVSEEYKETIKYFGTKVNSKSEVIDYLFLKNIPAKIVLKHKSLEEVLREILSPESKYKKDKFLEEIDGEYFVEFDKIKESIYH